MKRKAVKKSRVKNSSNSPIFFGEYRVCVSENRIALPTKIYNQLKSIDGLSGLRMARLPEGCIVLVPEKFWDYYCEAVAERRTSSTRNQSIRTFTVAAKTVSFRSKRRFTIPYGFMIPSLENNKRVAVVGVSHWIEIWAEERWEKNLTQVEKGERNP